MFAFKWVTSEVIVFYSFSAVETRLVAGGAQNMQIIFQIFHYVLRACCRGSVTRWDLPFCLYPFPSRAPRFLYRSYCNNSFFRNPLAVTRWTVLVLIWDLGVLYKYTIPIPVRTRTCTVQVRRTVLVLLPLVQYKYSTNMQISTVPNFLPFPGQTRQLQ